MAHKNMVNGTVYDTKGGKTMVAGTAYEIKKGRTMTGGTVYDINFSNGQPLGELAVGSIVKTNVNGVATEFLVVHQGKPSSLYDSSCNGTWLLMKDIYAKRQWDTAEPDFQGRVTRYGQTDIHNYLNNTFYNLLDEEIKKLLKSVNIPYVYSYYVSNENNTTIRNLETKIFLLSGPEVGRTFDQTYSRDGSILDVFANSSTAAPAYATLLNGTAIKWWTRTPYVPASRSVLVTYPTGGFGSEAPTSSFGVRPAMILPSDAVYDPNTNFILG